LLRLLLSLDSGIAGYLEASARSRLEVLLLRSFGAFPNGDGCLNSQSAAVASAAEAGPLFALHRISVSSAAVELGHSRWIGIHEVRLFAVAVAEAVGRVDC